MVCDVSSSQPGPGRGSNRPHYEVCYHTMGGTISKRWHWHTGQILIAPIIKPHTGAGPDWKSDSYSMYYFKLIKSLTDLIEIICTTIWEYSLQFLHCCIGWQQFNFFKKFMTLHPCGKNLSLVHCWHMDWHINQMHKFTEMQIAESRFFHTQQRANLQYLPARVCARPCTYTYTILICKLDHETSLKVEAGS